MKQKYLEFFGRFGVILSIVVSVNRSSWYQSIALNDFNIYILSFSLGIMLSYLWVCLPLFNKENN